MFVANGTLKWIMAIIVTGQKQQCTKCIFSCTQIDQEITDYCPWKIE